MGLSDEEYFQQALARNLQQTTRYIPVAAQEASDPILAKAFQERFARVSGEVDLFLSTRTTEQLMHFTPESDGSKLVAEVTAMWEQLRILGPQFNTCGDIARMTDYASAVRTVHAEGKALKRAIHDAQTNNGNAYLDQINHSIGEMRRVMRSVTGVSSAYNH
jgi:hypothetical protein